MKLKKIASLALAGVMAVSMLTACGEANNNDDTQKPTEPDVTPAAGYSATFENRLSALAASNIDMSDSADLNAALKAAMDFAADSHIAKDYGLNWNDTVNFIASTKNGSDLNQVAIELVSKADTDKESMNQTSAEDTLKVLNPLNNKVPYGKDNVDVVMLYVVDGGLSTDAAVMEVADKVNSEIEELVKTYNTVDTDAATHEVDYNYTGSVSADTITLDADHGKSMTFVAVEVVRHLGR